jgi:hypothetical protein
VAAQRTQANLKVDAFAVSSGGGSTRLEFPRAEVAELRGRAGRLEYVASELVFEALEGRFGPLHWTCNAGTVGELVLREPEGRFELAIDRVELPRGVQLTRAADGGIELVAPEMSLADVRVRLPDLQALRKHDGGAVARSAPEPAGEPDEARPLRQERLRFLDAVEGTVAFRVKVVLDLPVIGKRTLDQPVRVRIDDGSFDYRALDDGLDWLEGAFLDLGVSDGRFKVGWSVPLLKSKEIISWALAPDALALAKLNRIPLRALTDVRIGGKPSTSDAGARAEAGAEGRGDGKGEGKKRLRSMTIADIEVALSMAAPHAVEVGGGTILFGDEERPGIVDLHVGGALVHPPAPGGLVGRIGGLDTTLKDVRAGGTVSTFDRLHIDGIEELTLAFDGFTPTSLAATLRRVTATNVALVIG